MAHDRRQESTPRLAPMPRQREGPRSGSEPGVSPRAERSCQHRRRRRAGRRLLVGFVVMAGVALAVAGDFLQFRTISEQADAHQLATSVMPAGRAETAH